MNDQHVVEHLLAYVNGTLDDATFRRVKEHLAACGDCRQECEALAALWNELGRSPEEQPAASLEKNFHHMLRVYEQGLRHAGLIAERQRGKGYLHRMFFGRPALQLGFAVVILAIGLLLGYSLDGSGRNSREMAELHEEVRGLRNLLTVSLLHQESASERLKGVSWSSRLEGRDPDITAALVNTMKHDRNVNVRLAALDALTRDIGSTDVRREIIHTLPQQTSPLMQIALADVLVQLNDKDSREVLQQVLKKPDLHPAVRKRIMLGIQQIL